LSLPLIVDASGALKWVLDEDDSLLARTLASRDLTAPDLLWSECANGLSRWVRTGTLSKRVARERFAAIRRAPAVLTPTAGLLDRALILAIDLGHPMYDCI
jgi:predicted nucleic acid-binding protein